MNIKKILILTFCLFSLINKSFAIQPLTEEEQKLSDSVLVSIFSEDFKKSPTYIIDLLNTANDLIDSNTILSEIIAKRAFYATTYDKYKSGALNIIALSSLAKIQSNAIDILKNVSVSNQELLDQIENEKLRKIIHYLALKFSPSDEMPAFIYTIAEFAENYDDKLAAEKFGQNILDFILFNTKFDVPFKIENDTINIKDVAVFYLKQIGNSKIISDMVEFSKEDSEIINYGLNKNPDDAKLLLCKSLLNPYPLKKEKSWDNGYHSVFPKQRDVRKFKVNSKNILNDTLCNERIVDLQKAERIDTSLKVIHYVLSQFYEVVENYDSMLVELNRALTQYSAPAKGTGGQNMWEKLNAKKIDACYNSENYSELVKTYELMSSHIPDYNSRIISKAIPNAYLELNMPQKAYAYLNDSINIEHFMSEASFGLDWGWGVYFSWVYLLSQHYDKAKELEDYYKEGKFYSPNWIGHEEEVASEDTSNLAIVFMNIGHCYLNENSTKKALKYYQQGREMYIRHNDEDKEKSKAKYNNYILDDFNVMRKYGLPVPDTELVIEKLELPKSSVKDD